VTRLHPENREAHAASAQIARSLIALNPWRSSSSAPPARQREQVHHAAALGAEHGTGRDVIADTSSSCRQRPPGGPFSLPCSSSAVVKCIRRDAETYGSTGRGIRGGAERGRLRQGDAESGRRRRR